MTELPPPDPATRSTVYGRPAWTPLLWVVFAVGILALALIVNAVGILPFSLG